MVRKTPLTLFLLSLTLLPLGLLHPSHARAETSGEWQARFSGLWVDPDVGFFDLDEAGDRFETDADSGFGIGLGLERRLNHRLGLEAAIQIAEPELGLDAALAGIRFRASDRIRFDVFSLGLNFHLTPDRAVDLYVGPVLAYVSFGDLSIDTTVGDGLRVREDFDSDDDFALGAQIGADVGLGSGRWSLNLAARWLDTTLEVTDDEGEVTDLGFEPLILSAGFGVRF